MTTWDNIYKNYEKGGAAWATLSEGLIPEFLRYVEGAKFDLKNALDIGCGTGKYMRYLAEKGFTIAGIDSSETAIKMTRNVLPDASLKCVNMFEYEIPDQKYDFIYSISTIHHGLKSDIQALLNKIYSALVPNGKVFITLPDLESGKRRDLFKDHENLALGTYAPLLGPEKGLAHSFYNEAEINTAFSKFKNIKLQLDEIGRWVITANK